MKNPIVHFNYGDTTDNGLPDLRRYKWRVADFETQDESCFRALINGAMEGLLRGAVLTGLDMISVTGLNFTVASGAAVGPSGNLMVLYNVATGALPAVTASGGARHLIVLRPGPETPSGYITKLTDPANQVPLAYAANALLAVVDGNGLSGTAPTVQDGDVILGAVKLIVSQSTNYFPSRISRQRRAVPGRNSSESSGELLGVGDAFDERCRPWLYSQKVVGIKPSQTLLNFPTRLLFPFGGNICSLFPMSGGAFNGFGLVSGTLGDPNTYLDMQAGTVTGADADSPDFTPTVPTAGNYIVAGIFLLQTNKLEVRYGTQGTYGECMDGIRTSLSSGAGAVPLGSAGWPIAYVLVGSGNGSTVTDMEVVDMRRAFPATNVQKAVYLDSATTTAYTMTGDEEIITLENSTADITITLCDVTRFAGKLFRFDRLDTAGAFKTRLSRAGSDPFFLPSSPTFYDMLEPAESVDLYAALKGSTYGWKPR